MEAFLCVILILSSAYLSASEVALLSLSKFQLRTLKDTLRSSYIRIRRLISDPPGLLLTLLVFNEVVNVSLSTLITRMVSHNEQLNSLKSLPIPQWMAISLAGIIITTPIILIFCEIIPKVIGIRLNQIIASFNSAVIYLAYSVFAPIRFILRIGIHLFTNRAQTNKATDELQIKEEEFIQLAEEGLRQGDIKRSELDLIRNVFELDDRKVKEILTPLRSVYSIHKDTAIKQAISFIQQKIHNRIPVFDQSRSHIIGILYAKDLMIHQVVQNPSHKTVRDVMEKPVYVPEDMQLNTLFRNLKNQKTHMAVVRDKNHRAIGIVTMHDLLEEIFEGIHES